MHKLSKITLGTAQLGMNYGISNINGKPNFNASIDILKYSWDHGIRTFDTSPLYGDSESIIGSFITLKENEDLKDLVIMSKLPKIEISSDLSLNTLYATIKRRIIRSLSILGIDKFRFYLIHHAPDIQIKDGIIVECLNQIKKEKLIERIGISIYNSEEAEAALKFKEIDVIQVPINIFDHRLITSGIIQKLKTNNYIIFARSIYLQGLLFKSPATLPKDMAIAKEFLFKLQRICYEQNLDIAMLSLLFVRDIPEIDSLVIGAEKIEQIKNNLNILKKQPLSSDLRQQILEEFSEVPEKIINPTLWNL